MSRDDEREPSRELERQPEREPANEHDAEIVRARSALGPPSREARGAEPPRRGGEPGATGGGGEGWLLTWKRFQACAIVAFVLASGVLLGGLDRKAPSPPQAPVTESDVPGDQITVDFRDDAKEEEIAALGAAIGVQFRYIYGGSISWRGMVATVAPAKRDGVLAALRLNPLVEAAGPAFALRLHWDGSTPPNDPYYAKQWHLRFVNVEEAWKVTRGAGAVVAVVDSGVASEDDGPFRQAQDLRQTKFTARRDIVNDDTHPEDDISHGTHVAGTIAESTDNGLLGAGIAPEATIIPVKVCAQNGCSDPNIAAGVRWAVDNGAKVINLSLGGPHVSDVLKLALVYAHQKGVSLVCSAGNDLQENGPNHVKFPAALPECIAVSAVGPQGNLAPYSDHGDQIDIAAPGGDTSAGKDYAVWQDISMPTRRGIIDGLAPKEGTSMAAPHVTGVVALLNSLGVTDPDEVRSILRRSSRPRAPAVQFGAGILDAAAAVNLARQGGRQMNKRLGLAAALGVAALAIGFWRWQSLGVDATLCEVLLALAIGLCLPDAVQWMVGYGSLLNMIGHSIAVPILWLNVRGRGATSLRRALAATIGLVVHLAMDAQSGATPFAVLPQWRSTLWMWMNAGIGLGLLLFAFEERSGRTIRVPFGRRAAAAAGAAVLALLTGTATVRADDGACPRPPGVPPGARYSCPTHSQTYQPGEPIIRHPGGSPGRRGDPAGSGSANMPSYGADPGRTAPGASVHCQIEQDGQCHCGPRRGTGRQIPCIPQQDAKRAPRRDEPANCGARLPRGRGKLCAEGGRFLDEDGRVVVLRGVNLAGSSKIPPYLPLPRLEGAVGARLRDGIMVTRDFDFLSHTDMTLLDPLPALGINVLRLLFIWEGYEPFDGEKSEPYLAMLEAIAREAWSRGIYSIIDFHQDAYSRWMAGGCGEGFPQWTIPQSQRGRLDPPDNRAPKCTNWMLQAYGDDRVQKSFDALYARGELRGRYLDVIRTLAERFAGVPGVIGFDPLNEPFSRSPTLLPLDERNLQAIYRDAAAVVRGVSPSTILFLEPDLIIDTGAASTLALPSGLDGVAYAPHFYSPVIMQSRLAEQTGEIVGAPGGSLGGRIGGAIASGLARLVAGMNTSLAFVNMRAKASEWNAPLFLGEFGALAESPPKVVADYMDTVHTELNRTLASAAQWSYTPGWNEDDKDGWNGEDLSIVANEQNRLCYRPALFRPRAYPERVAGTPGRLAVDATSLRFDWTASGATSNETEIYVPDPAARRISECRQGAFRRAVGWLGGLGGAKRVTIDTSASPGLECILRADSRVVCRAPDGSASLRVSITFPAS